MQSKMTSTWLPILGLAFGGLVYAQGAAPQEKKQAETKPSAPAPKRDLSGVWTLRGGGGRGGEQPELTAWGLEKFKQAKSSNSGEYKLEETNDPVITKCVPPGTPRVYYHPFPFQFLKDDKSLTMVFEYDHTVRHIFTDGRPVPADPDVTYMGTSIGHWVDDTTLVVETVGQNTTTWLDRNGHQHSDQLKVTETFHRMDMDHMEIAAKMEDPKALAKPWTVRFNAQLRPKWELAEQSCAADNANFAAFEK